MPRELGRAWSWACLSAWVTAMLSPTSGQRAQGAGLRDHLGQAPLIPSRACSGFCLDSLPSERPSCSDTAQYERSGFCCLIRNSRLPCVPNIMPGWAHSRALCPPGPGESLDLQLGGWRCPVCGFCQRGSSFWVTVLCRSAPRLAADAGTGFPKREVDTSEGSFIAVLSLLLTAIYIYIYLTTMMKNITREVKMQTLMSTEQKLFLSDMVMIRGC